MQPFESMITVNALCAAPVAVANWIGLAGRDERPSARILLYHGTPRSSASALERQLRWLKRRFNIVPLRSIVSAASNGGAVDGRVALTFDDGLRSNIEVAYPILFLACAESSFVTGATLMVDAGRSIL